MLPAPNKPTILDKAATATRNDTNRYAPHTHRKLALFTFVALALLFFVKCYQAAPAVTLSGKVTGQASSPIANATAQVLNPADNSTVASGMTDTNGNYTIALGNGGTYHVKVTPPADSNYQAAIKQSQTINADTTLDFALVPAAAVTLSGRVLDGQGVGIAGMTVYVQPADGGATQQVQTNASGAYSFKVAPGDYKLVTNGSPAR